MAEKEKTYDEAINKLQSLINNANKQGHIIIRVEDIENSFPELTESEDERIRKELISFLQLPHPQFVGERKQEKWIAWLEKQKLTQNINKEDEEVRQYIVRIMEQRDKNVPMVQKALAWLKKQGEPTCINPSEFDLRLNELLKQFETLPKEELVYILSLYLNVVQNDGTYKPDEKQGEQKPTLRERYKNIAESEWFKKTHEGMSVSDDEKVDNVNKVEPKFKVGEWIISDTVDKDYHICKITGIKDGNYAIESIYGHKGYNKFDVFDNAYRLWTIDNAKDGCIVVEDKIKEFPSPFIAIFKRRNGDDFESHCFIGFNGKFYTGEAGHDLRHLHPATKEQRDFLFSKMNEAGYEWDAETKELKKIKQKFAWGDNWLKSLKQSIGG